jgi:hypothetical protein
MLDSGHVHQTPSPSGLMVLIQLLLPTAAPNVLPEDAAKALVVTRRELTDTFSGLTAYMRSPAKGAWTTPDGRTEHDDVVMVEVVTAEFDRAWWRGYASTLAKRFQQDTIHVRALPIELLDEWEESTDRISSSGGQAGR